MLGAITGDIIGSIYEWRNIKTKDFTLFDYRCKFTDDSVLTVAVADALMNDLPIADCLRKYGRMYPRAGYGGYFHNWLNSDDAGPYGSYGNGSAMRVSPAGWFYDSLEETIKKAVETASVTHNHPEGIKGAEAVAVAIYLARNGSSKDEIRKAMDTYYNLDFTLDEIRPVYKFDTTCQGSVPQAIAAFLESVDFKDAIRNAVSIGGDSDTIAAIAGSIAESFYGIPHDTAFYVVSFKLDDTINNVIRQFSQKTGLYKQLYSL